MVDFYLTLPLVISFSSLLYIFIISKFLLKINFSFLGETYLIADYALALANHLDYLSHLSIVADMEYRLFFIQEDAFVPQKIDFLITRSQYSGRM